MKLVSAAIMREIDRAAIDGRSIPSDDLMENAGGGIAVRILEDLVNSSDDCSVAVFCGKGNNGGDGFVIARQLHRAGLSTQLYFVGPGDSLSADARLNLTRAVEAGLQPNEINTTADFPEFLESDIIVDAIFGTGFAGAPRGLAADMIEFINEQDAIVVAVDMPSGLNADTGQAEGEVVAADYTYTLALPKFGLFLSPGRELAGEVEIVPIGIPDDILTNFDLPIELITSDVISDLLPDRLSDGHKGDFGRLVVLAGSRGMVGAATLSALASMRSGTGLVTVAGPSSIQPILATKLTEAMTHPLPDVSGKGVLALRGLGEIRQMLAGADALVLGPGLGRHHETQELVRRLVGALGRPAVIDADGLNALAGHLDVLDSCSEPLVLTPHSGEFARLTGQATPDDFHAKAAAARKFAASHDVTLVLKGSPTIVTSPDGACWLNPSGNHGMATGGSGDVLSGIIGAFVAQGLTATEAAICGVYIHGLAGDMAADELTPRAMIAGDLIDFLPNVFELLE